jgi:hypothetical protein
MCCCDADPPTIHNQSDHKAAKLYACSECRRTIAKGETYTRIDGLWDGSWSTFRWCAHCAASVEILTARAHAYNLSAASQYYGQACVCWTYGEIWSEVYDAEVRDFGACRLYHSAERRWTYRRGPRKGELMPVPMVPVTA